MQGQGREALMAAPGPDPAASGTIVRAGYDGAWLDLLAGDVEAFPGAP